MANGNNGGSFITGFLLGGVVGAIVGILVAPRAGSETRAQLLDQGAVLRERAEEMVGSTMETVRERVAPVTDAVAAHVPGRTSNRPENPLPIPSALSGSASSPP